MRDSPANNVNADVLASIFVESLKSPISKTEVRNSLSRNTRFLPAESLEDYQSLVFLEASEIPAETLDAKAFEAICNRVSKRLAYAAKVRSERFAPFDKLEHELSIKDSSFHISELLEQLTLEEQSYVLMIMEGLTWKEIAAKLKMPLSTAHHNWAKVAEKLKVLLK